MVSHLLGNTSIEAGLYDYLTKQGDYDGPAKHPFEAVRLFDGMRIGNRNDARRELRSRIGNRVFLDRRPQTSTNEACIVLQLLSGGVETGLAGDEQCEEALIEATAYTTGDDAARKAATIAGLLQCCLGGYHNGYWGTIAVGECTVRPSRTLAQAPPDGGDSWIFTRSLNVSVYYYSAIAPTYSEVVLQAIPAAQFDGSIVRLNGSASVAATRRTIVSMLWQLYTPASSSPILQINGAPGSIVTTAGCTGTIAVPSVNTTTHTGLQNASVTVALTVTDSEGATAVGRVTVVT